MITNIKEINSELPVDLFEAKQHLIIDHDLDDEYIVSLIKAAVSIAENHTSRKLTSHQVQMFNDNAFGVIHFPYGNISNITITAQRSLLQPPTDYVTGIDRVVLRKRVTDVEFNFLCGFTVETCPADIKHAILMLVGTMYESRLDISHGVQQFKAHLSSTTILNRYKLY